MAGVSSRAAPRPTKRIIVTSLLLLTLLFPLLSFFPSSSEKKPVASDVQGAVAEGRLALVTETFPGSGCKRAATAREEEGSRVVQELETEERSKAFEKIFATDFWGGGESRSGPGSRIDYTANVRILVAHAIKEYHVQHILDAPCGDVNWQPLIEGFNSTHYTGYDIVPDIITKNRARFQSLPNVDFARLDFVNTPLPISPDLIICRDGIQHNTLKDGVRGFLNLEASGARYLVTNWHTETGRGTVPDNAVNLNVPFGGAYPINVFTHPFNFSMPEFFISEGVGGVNGDGKLAGVWKLPALWKGDGRRFVVPAGLMPRARGAVVSKVDVQNANLL